MILSRPSHMDFNPYLFVFTRTTNHTNSYFVLWTFNVMVLLHHVPFISSNSNNFILKLHWYEYRQLLRTKKKSRWILDRHGSYINSKVLMKRPGVGIRIDYILRECDILWKGKVNVQKTHFHKIYTFVYWKQIK